jgi:hypothetical protein
MAIRIVDDFTGITNTNGHAPDQTAIDRRQLQIENSYVTHHGLAHIPPPQPLIDGWLMKNSLAWLAGKPGDGKSFIALDMAYSVATGQPWQGHPTTQGTVLYIAAEGASGLSIRANAWTTANGNPDYIPIYYLPLAVRLTQPDEIDVQALAQALDNLQPDLVIIDTQARVTVGAEENSAKDMGWFIDALETLRSVWPATYLTVHHTPRNGDNLRGSIALEGAAETVLLSIKDGDLITLKCQKQKNAAPADDFQMYMQPLGDSVILSHEAVGLEGVNDHAMGPAEKTLLKEFWDLHGTDEYGATLLQEESTLPKQTHLRARSRLVKTGFLNKRDQGQRVWYRISPKAQSQLVPPSPMGPGP